MYKDLFPPIKHGAAQQNGSKFYPPLGFEKPLFYIVSFGFLSKTKGYIRINNALLGLIFEKYNLDLQRTFLVRGSSPWF